MTTAGDAPRPQHEPSDLPRPLHPQNPSHPSHPSQPSHPSHPSQRHNSAAVFLDRDGTLIEEAHYLADPDRVVLLPGVAAALRSLAVAGYALVIVTNQSGIARGLYTAADFAAVQRRLEELLHAEGVRFDAVFHCPHHPEFGPACDCRKPGLGMYRAAAELLGLDLAASVYIGDRVKDVLPALATGGRGFLVRTGYGSAEAAALPAHLAGVSAHADAPDPAATAPPATGGAARAPSARIEVVADLAEAARRLVPHA